MIGQLRYPREYRLPPSISQSSKREVESAIEQLVSVFGEGVTDAPSSEHLEDELSELAVQLWRLGNRLVDPKTREPTEEMRVAYGRLQAAWDSMHALGIEVRDYTFQEIADHGITGIRIVAEEPKADLKRRTVIETLKPAVIYRGRQLGLAEVIVGTPPESDEPNIESSPEP